MINVPMAKTGFSKSAIWWILCKNCLLGILKMHEMLTLLRPV